jgi:antitoxin component of MazEF toxin-antitoxin module
MKLRLRKIGNSIGVIIPSEAVKCYNIGDEIDVIIADNVITSTNNVITKSDNVITKSDNVITDKGKKLLFDAKKGIYNRI